MTQPANPKDQERQVINDLIKKRSDFLVLKGFWQYATEFRKAQMAWNNGENLRAWVLFEDENYHDIAEAIYKFAQKYRF